MKIGRNDPCPCGSGKKYKKCCLDDGQSEIVEDLGYRRFRQVEKTLIPRLYRHAAEVFGPGSIEEAWDEFHCWNSPHGFDPASPFNQIFGPYFLFRWEVDPEDPEFDSSLHGKTVAESFLDANRELLSVDALTYLEAANRPVFSFFEITNVIPGQGMTLRNILTNEESDVTEHTGSLGAQRGGVLFAALIQLAGKCQAVGTAPYALPPSSIQNLVEARKNLLKGNKTKQLKNEHLLDYDIEIRELYFELLEPLLNPQPPTLCNTDGDLFVLQTLHFEVEDSDEAFNALQSISKEFVTAEEIRSRAKIREGRVVEAEIPWIKPSKSTRSPGSNICVATILIAGSKMTVQVNSNKRAAAVKRKILTALGDKVKFKLKSIESIDRVTEDLRSQGSKKSSLIPPDQLPPEVAASFAKMAEEHWVKWFDTKIPALNDKTPKQAARSKEGRELLEALLNSYEQGTNVAKNEATNLFKPDVKMIRSKLGLVQEL